jgi:hypothetical protein
MQKCLPLSPPHIFGQCSGFQASSYVFRRSKSAHLLAATGKVVSPPPTFIRSTLSSHLFAHCLDLGVFRHHFLKMQKKSRQRHHAEN